jgi:hypothetical protein
LKVFLDKVAHHFNMECVDRPSKEELEALGWTIDPAKNSIIQALGVSNRHNAWEAVGKGFSQTYQKLHQGRMPPLDPWARRAWATARENTGNSTSDPAAAVKIVEDAGAIINQYFMHADKEMASKRM